MMKHTENFVICLTSVILESDYHVFTLNIFLRISFDEELMNIMIKKWYIFLLQRTQLRFFDFVNFFFTNNRLYCLKYFLIRIEKQGQLVHIDPDLRISQYILFNKYKTNFRFKLSSTHLLLFFSSCPIPHQISWGTRKVLPLCRLIHRM